MVRHSAIPETKDVKTETRSDMFTILNVSIVDLNFAGFASESTAATTSQPTTTTGAETTTTTTITTETTVVTEAATTGADVTTDADVTSEEMTTEEATTVLYPCHTPRGVGNGLITSPGPYYPNDRVT